MLPFALLSTGFAWKLVQDHQCAGDSGQLVGYGRLWDCKRACLADEDCIGFQFGTHWSGNYECMGSCQLVKECTELEESDGDFFFIGDRPTYTHHASVQCAADPEYYGDIEMNPIIGYWIGYLTLDDCKAECKGWKDEHGRECVAVEWQAHEDDDDCPDIALCALAWGCDYTVLWEFGDTYIMDEPVEVELSEREVAFATLIERFEARIIEIEIEEIEEEIQAMENEDDEDCDDEVDCDDEDVAKKKTGCRGYRKYTRKQKCFFLGVFATFVICCTCGFCCAKGANSRRRRCRRTVTLVTGEGQTTAGTTAGGETCEAETAANTARTSGEDGPQEEEPSKSDESNTAPPMNEKEGPGPEEQPPAADEVEEPSVLNVEESIQQVADPVEQQKEEDLALTLDDPEDDPEKGKSTEL